jgi:hypothetical protein
MFDDLANYFVNDVMAAYHAYFANISQSAGSFKHTRHAIALATALFHLREHVPGHHKQTRAQIEGRCSDYRLIADVTNAAKHHTVTQTTPQGPSLVEKASDIEEKTIITLYSDVDGEYSEMETAVFISCSDGVERSLDEALQNVLNFWIEEMKNLGIITLPPVLNYVRPGTTFVSREKAKSLPFEIKKGLDWKNSMQLLKFDNAKQRSSPFDLTGHQIKMNIYENPPIRVALILTSPDGSQSFEAEVELSREQSDEYRKLKTASEKEAFMQRIAAERREEFQRGLQADIDQKGFIAEP